MKVVEVKSDQQARVFLKFPVRLYRNDPNYIRPLNKDIEQVFSVSQNKYFKHGECTRWILLDDNRQPIGRIAAFINFKTANTFDQPTGGTGFFECINDRKAAHLLFDTAKAWLTEHKMEAMDGPINFGERDRWWGLLVEGFTPPTYGMNYNFPYYQDLFESYGWKVFYRQFSFARKIKEGGLDPKILEKANKIKENTKYSFRHIDRKNLEKYATDFRIVFNKAWAKHLGVKPMSEEQAMSILNKMKPVLDEQLVWFGYYEDQPIAFYINLPELNQIFRYVNGKLNWLGKMKFLYHKKMKTVRKVFGVSFGVIPEHQGKGVEGALMDAFSTVAWTDKFQYLDLEMTWIGDFNPKMIHICETLGAEKVKTLHTYRKLFDESIPFKRAPVMEYK